MSYGQVVIFILSSRSERSCMVIGLNTNSEWGGGGPETQTDGIEGQTLIWTLLTLSTNKFRKSLLSDTEDMATGGTMGETTEFMVSNSILGFLLFDEISWEKNSEIDDLTAIARIHKRKNRDNVLKKRKYPVSRSSLDNDAFLMLKVRDCLVYRLAIVTQMTSFCKQGEQKSIF